MSLMTWYLRCDLCPYSARLKRPCCLLKRDPGNQGIPLNEFYKGPGAPGGPDRLWKKVRYPVALKG